jgi:GT2 family glycosyltransferase
VIAVTVNWNRPTDTIECLRSLTCQTYLNIKVIVVDNGSTDGSVEIIAREFPQVEMIAYPHNLGFAGGYNLGMRRALDLHADFVFIINNDAVIEPDGVSQLMLHVEENSGILAPLIFYYAHPDRIWSSGGKVHPWILEKHDRWMDKKDPGDWPEVLEQSFVNGCVMLFPTKALRRVGLFDESFHLYYEDSDLCRRVQMAGYSILVVPKAKAWHKVALSSGGRESPQERYWMARSSIRFFRKHTRGMQMVAVLIWRSGSAIRTSLKLIFKGNLASLLFYWRGLVDGLFLDRSPN